MAESSSEEEVLSESEVLESDYDDLLESGDYRVQTARIGLQPYQCEPILEPGEEVEVDLQNFFDREVRVGRNDW